LGQKLLGIKWLDIKDVAAYKELIKCTRSTELRNLGKLLCEKGEKSK